jgi:hypothetical protein
MLSAQTLREESVPATDLGSPPIDVLGRGTPHFGCGNISPTPEDKLTSKGQLEEKIFPPTASSIKRTCDLLKKHMSTFASLQVAYGMAETRSRRYHMEDTLCKEHWLKPLRIGDDTSSKECLLVGVGDGHADQGLVSKYVASNIEDLEGNVRRRC